MEAEATPATGRLGLVIRKVFVPMRCQEALQLWSASLKGQPVDPDQLNEADMHLLTCRGDCARALDATLANSVAHLRRPGGRPDLSEATGLRHEEEGDAHLLFLWRLTRAGISSVAELEHERAAALEQWRLVEEEYRAGLEQAHTAFLREALARLSHRRATLARLRLGREPGRS